MDSRNPTRNAKPALGSCAFVRAALGPVGQMLDRHEFDHRSHPGECASD